MRQMQWFLGSFFPMVWLLLQPAFIGQNLQAQPRLAVDADTLHFGNQAGAVNTLSLWNAGSDTLRIDSLRFQIFNTAHGWALELTTSQADSTYRVDYAFGILRSPDVFPDIFLVSEDTLNLEIIAFDLCLVCGGKRRTSRGDTLYVFSNDPSSNPYVVLIDFTFYVAAESDIAPPAFSLQTYPNPTNGATTIELRAAEAGTYDLAVYNLLGQRLFSTQARLGTGQRWRKQWPDSGEIYSSGVYFVRVFYDQRVHTTTLLLTK